MLIDFGDGVTAFLAGNKSGTTSIRKYSKAVDRAASDLANRRSRQEALESALSAIWKL
jgi:ribulose 1,5-bisphosphate carboxylase large subunit-like protein